MYVNNELDFIAQNALSESTEKSTEKLNQQRNPVLYIYFCLYFLSLVGAILFNSAIFCALIQPLRSSLKKSDHINDTESAKPQQNGSKPTSDGQSKSNGSCKGKMNILNSFTYKVYILDIVYCTGFWFIYGGHLVLLTFTPIRASYLGFTKHQGAWLVSVCGIASGTLR